MFSARGIREVVMRAFIFGLLVLMAGAARAAERPVADWAVPDHPVAAAIQAGLAERGAWTTSGALRARGGDPLVIRLPDPTLAGFFGRRLELCDLDVEVAPAGVDMDFVITPEGCPDDAVLVLAGADGPEFILYGTVGLGGTWGIDWGAPTSLSGDFPHGSAHLVAADWRIEWASLTVDAEWVEKRDGIQGDVGLRLGNVVAVGPAGETVQIGGVSWHFRLARMAPAPWRAAWQAAFGKQDADFGPLMAFLAQGPTPAWGDSYHSLAIVGTRVDLPDGGPHLELARLDGRLEFWPKDADLRIRLRGAVTGFEAWMPDGGPGPADLTLAELASATLEIELNEVDLTLWADALDLTATDGPSVDAFLDRARGPGWGYWFLQADAGGLRLEREGDDWPSLFGTLRAQAEYWPQADGTLNGGTQFDLTGLQVVLPEDNRLFRLARLRNRTFERGYPGLTFPIALQILGLLPRPAAIDPKRLYQVAALYRDRLAGVVTMNGSLDGVALLEDFCCPVAGLDGLGLWLEFDLGQDPLAIEMRLDVDGPKGWPNLPRHGQLDAILRGIPSRDTSAANLIRAFAGADAAPLPAMPPLGLDIASLTLSDRKWRLEAEGDLTLDRSAPHGATGTLDIGVHRLATLLNWLNDVTLATRERLWDIRTGRGLTSLFEVELTRDGDVLVNGHRMAREGRKK